MKFKFLFLGMLAAAAMVGCNNDVVGPNGSTDDPESGTVEGISTTATFTMQLTAPGTYAGESDEIGQGGENAINDAALIIYKLDGTPEAFAYLGSNTDWLSGGSGKANSVTLKCYSGDKLIYFAANSAGNKLINLTWSSSPASNSTAPGWLGTDWTATSGTIEPAVQQFVDLNRQLWSTGLSTFAFAASATAIQNALEPAEADGLIIGLANGGTAGSNLPTQAGATGTPTNLTAVLMTNWGDATYQNPDNGDYNGGTGTNYISTCKFNLKASVTAAESQAATPSATNANKNGLLINIQRALAKVEAAIPASGKTAGPASPSGNDPDMYGRFTADANWAVGNISVAEYPFQQWDAQKVKSVLYDSTGALGTVNANWEKELDNTRWIPTAKKYSQQNLTTADVRGQITPSAGPTPNQPWGTTRIYVTENNNKNTLNQYSTFIVFAGQYLPNHYLDSASVAPGGGTVTTIDGTLGAPGTTSGSPATEPSWSATPDPSGNCLDTLYYVQTLKKFFWGKKALKRYIGWVVLAQSATYDPAATSGIDATHTANIAAVNTYIDGLKTTTGNVQADLQAYWHGYCFYRVWIRDAYATSSANKILVRRNHVYKVSVDRILSPGIGDPNDIIDPDPTDPEPIEEAETYVTASITIMNWHVVNQSADGKLE